MKSKRVTRSQVNKKVGSHTTLRYTPRLPKKYYNLRPRKSTQGQFLRTINDPKNSSRRQTMFLYIVLPEV